MKIVAVIVTYNRLELLKKCLSAVKQQIRLPDEIIVIDNGSTDGTGQWLSQQDITVFPQENTGGAGGFTQGIKLAYQHYADWIWVMDDDTVPQSDALFKLVEVLIDLGPDQHETGFLSSKVLWIDGNIHEMNKTYLLTDKLKLDNLSISDKNKWQLIQFGTFVSMLINADAVLKVGLPIKEYFIWNDDVEYTKRMIGCGFAGIAVEESIVQHETPINTASNVFKDSNTQLWKYHYGLRNELFTKRLHEGEAQFWTTWLHRVFVMPFRIAINRTDHRWSFIKAIWGTSWRGMFFKPEINYVQKRVATNTAKINRNA